MHCNCTVICGMYVVRAFPCVGCFMGCNACFTGGVCVCVVWYGVVWGWESEREASNIKQFMAASLNSPEWQVDLT